MKILNSKQLKEIDQYTIDSQGLSSWELMERASISVVNTFCDDEGEALFNLPVSIICAKGNNGGDGLAIARLLIDRGIKVNVFLIASEAYSDDNLQNQLLLKNIQVINLDDKLELPSTGYLMDCLFGYGLNQALTEDWRPLIKQINAFGGKVIAIDLPSGLPTDGKIPATAAIVKAAMVYTFQYPKLALLLPQFAEYVESFKILDIGLATHPIHKFNDQPEYLDLAYIQSLLKARPRFGHKGTFGHVLIIGGSIGKMGAVFMAAKAALRTGCGLVTTYIPQVGLSVLQTSFPEGMVLLDEGHNYLQKLPGSSPFSSIGIGVGMDKEQVTVQAFQDWMLQLKGDQRICFDADALNILSAHPQLLQYIPKDSILTPHPKELARLIGSWDNDFEKFEKAQSFVNKHAVVLLIKGAHTAILSTDHVLCINSSGNSGMATGGAGDVLTGIISSLIAQGYPSFDAACIAVYMHGLAGDLAAKEGSQQGIIATDIIHYLAKAQQILNAKR